MERAGLKSYLLPSIGDVLFVSIFIRLLFLGGTLLYDGDTGWHLATGEAILDKLSVPHFDTYSYTAAGNNWVSHEWLSDALFACLNRLGGLNGVVVFTAAVIAFTFWLMYRFTLSRGAGPLAAAIFTVVAVSASAGSMLARPHILSYPLTLGFFWVLDDYQKGIKDRLYLLPPLTVIWANLHAAFILGIVFVLLCASGNLLSWYTGEAPGESSKKSKRLVIVLGLCLLAALLNPHGASIYGYLLKLPGSENVVGSIIEWASPNFHETRVFEALVLGVLALLVMSDNKPGLFEGGVLVALLHLSLQSIRFIPVFALIGGGVAAGRIGEASGYVTTMLPDGLSKQIVSGLGRISVRINGVEFKLRGHLFATAVVAAATVIAFNGGMAGGRTLMDYSFSAEKFPVEAYEYATKNGIKGRMFNEYGWGGYIIYRGGRDHKVFIDGRIEPYGPGLMKEYMTVSSARFGCLDVLDKYKVDWVMYRSGTPLCRLLEAKGWEKVYSDETAEILLRHKSL